MTSLRSGAVRAAPQLTGIVPAALLCIGVARHALTHFFVRAPVLLDAGWFSALVYRNGLIPDNPLIACDYAPTYYGVHLTPFLSALSLLSYLAPVGRIEWYALTQAIVYLPLAIAPWAVAAQLDRATALRRAPITLAAALAFCFGGQLL